MKRLFRRSAKISLILVYLVISAGAIVRMTGSGMGCPDWPKCFGYYVPPTERAELEWQSSKDYKEGQVIIIDETLWVANSNFTSGKDFSKDNWAQYTKHDYAEFNVYHTWTEFINRLLGALAGLAVLITAIFSLGYWNEKKALVFIAWLAVFGMGFQAWLGATVVYSVLEPIKITLHMIMALIIVAWLLYLVFKSRKEPVDPKYHRLAANLVFIALGMTILQIVLGTQVRQFVDEQIDLLGEGAKDLWLSDPKLNFYIHRSFSILVVLVNAYLAFIIYKNRLNLRKINWVLVLIGIEVLSGMAMYYIDFPFGSQPLHLLLASILFGLQYYLLLESRQTNKSL